MPPKLAMECSDSLEPVAILTSWERNTEEGSITKWFFHWKNKPVEEATWGPAADIKLQFPHLFLEDKESLLGGGIDGNPNELEAHKPKI